MSHLKPYDKTSDVYLKYTAPDAPQILLSEDFQALAKHIVGREDNPVKQASLIYDWIDAYFPWAGAREYSTIPNLAEYALNRGYGDCGQVSLLYINLLETSEFRRVGKADGILNRRMSEFMTGRKCISKE